MTKPIGVGTITTAIKQGIVPPDVEAEAIKVMATLNNVTEVLEPFAIPAWNTGGGASGRGERATTGSG